MKTAIITGSAGLIGAEAVRFFSNKGFTVAGIDNNMRMLLFGKEASTDWSRRNLESEIPEYVHYGCDIRDAKAMESVFSSYGQDIEVVIHTAAQPSHEWAARDPFTDFTVNANGTLTLLEMTRRHCPQAVFIFTSTNKVYGDRPNMLPLVELESRWEVDPSHPYYDRGIDESMSVDASTHSFYGVSKLAADLLVQEFGKYFGMKTACFRGGCLTGPGHSPTELHGFLAYLMKCNITGEHYTIFGYKGKQVRDSLHSYDLINAFWQFYRNPRSGEVYNMGGGRHSNCSVIEAIDLCENITGKKMNFSYSDANRVGDHIWWVSDASKYRSHYPDWGYKYDIHGILEDIYNRNQFSATGHYH